MSDSINMINVGGVDKLLEDTLGRNELAAESARLDSRINNIITSPSPSAEEITDARFGADEVTYPTLGDAIRTQFNDSWDFIKKDGIVVGGCVSDGVTDLQLVAGDYNGNNTTTVAISMFYDFKKLQTMKITANTNYQFNILYYNADFALQSSTNWQDGYFYYPESSTTYRYFRIEIRKYDSSTMSVDDAASNVTVEFTSKIFEEVKNNLGYFDVIKGYYINKYRHSAVNTKRATTGLLTFSKPFTIIIDPKYQMLMMSGNTTGNLTDRGWVLYGGDSRLHIDLSYGTTYAFNFAKRDSTEFTENDVVDIQIIFDDSEIKRIHDNIKPKYIVDVNGNGDFHYILDALKRTPDNSHIIVRKGNYNMKVEYEAYYGATYFDDYTGYDLSDWYSRGYWINGGRVIEFDPGAKVIFRYEGNNHYINSHFSVFATGYDATIIGAHIYYKNTKYAIHDDAWQNHRGTNVFKNIIIEGYPSSVAGIHVGGGCGGENTYIYENVIFVDDEMPDNYGDFYYHNNTTNNAAENRIILNSCYGERGLMFIWCGPSEKDTKCIISNCKFKSLTKRALDASQPYENMTLFAFNNDIDE